MHESRYILWQALLSYMWELFEYTCPQDGSKRRAFFRVGWTYREVVHFTPTSETNARSGFA